MKYSAIKKILTQSCKCCGKAIILICVVVMMSCEHISVSGHGLVGLFLPRAQQVVGSLSHLETLHLYLSDGYCLCPLFSSSLLLLLLLISPGLVGDGEDPSRERGAESGVGSRERT